MKDTLFNQFINSSYLTQIENISASLLGNQVATESINSKIPPLAEATPLAGSWIEGAFYIAMIFVTFCGAYKYNRWVRREQVFKDVELRNAISSDGEMNETQLLIDYEDKSLKSILDKLNEHGAKAGVNFNVEEQELHRNLNKYINYLESVVILKDSKWINPANWNGFWPYYFRKIMEWKPLGDYVSNPEYEWTDVVKEGKAAVEAFQRKVDMVDEDVVSKSTVNN